MNRVRAGAFPGPVSGQPSSPATRSCRAHQAGRVAQATVIDRTSSVHYLRFRLTEEQRAAFLRGAEVAVVADHSNYRARTVLEEHQRLALAADLLGR